MGSFVQTFRSGLDLDLLKSEFFNEVKCGVVGLLYPEEKFICIRCRVVAELKENPLDGVNPLGI